MKIGLRLLLGYFLIVAVAGYFVLSIFVQEVKPGVRRATEGTLVDTANLLAQIARQDMQRGDAAHGQLAQAFTQLNQRPIGANISGIRRIAANTTSILPMPRGELSSILPAAHRGRTIRAGMTFIGHCAASTAPAVPAATRRMKTVR